MEHSPLARRHKLAYGVGQVAEGFKNSAFGIFLFFYYNQVLGLSGSMAGAALLIALLFDAVTDPLAGSLSDATRSRWGRRHPWMVASAIPLGLAFYAVFNPPQGLGEWGLFAWLTVGAVAVRAAMTLYHVPHMALGAELSADYDERTSVVAWRTVMSIAAAGAVPLLGFFVFLRPSPAFEDGQLDPAAYPPFAATMALVMVASIWISAFGTASRIPTLPLPTSPPEPFSPARLLREVRFVLGSEPFRNLLTGVLVFFVMRGIQEALGIHMNTHFWELTTDQQGILYVPVLAGIFLGSAFWTSASKSLDKRPTFLIGVVMFSSMVFLPPVLRVVGWFPGNEDDVLILSILCAANLVAYFGAAAALVCAGSMMADLVDETDLRTGHRLEGIFFGALAFSGKCASGIGHQVAGWGVDWIGFPAGAAVGSVPAEVVRNLGILYGPGVLALAVVAFVFLARYGLSRTEVERIQAALATRG